MSTAAPPRSNLVRTIRLTEERLEKILDRLDVMGNSAAANKRATPRYTYRINGCVVHLQQPGDGSSTPFLVATRNLSAGGISFLHGGFVHPHSKCLVQLISAHGAWVNVTGTVLHCRYLESGIHEVALRFDAGIDPADYCPDALTSRVLLVTDDQAVVRLANVLLAQLKAAAEVADCGAVAVEKVAVECYDAVLVDLELSEEEGMDVVRELRASGYRGAVLAAASGQTPVDRELCLTAGCDACLPKPLERESVLGLLECLHEKPPVGAQTGGESLAQALTGFAATLPARIRALEEAAEAGLCRELVKLARDLNGEAAAYGHDTLAAAAEKVRTAAGKDQPPPDLAQHVNELIHQCLRARCIIRKAHPN